MASSSESSRPVLVVAALDFGTTYSGYAFSFIDKPNEIYTNQVWSCEKYSLASIKTPTCVLINKENREDSTFGYEAENEYGDIQADDEAHDYFFFDRFKMELHSRKVIWK